MPRRFELKKNGLQFLQESDRKTDLLTTLPKHLKLRIESFSRSLLSNDFVLSLLELMTLITFQMSLRY